MFYMVKIMFFVVIDYWCEKYENINGIVLIEMYRICVLLKGGNI